MASLVVNSLWNCNVFINGNNELGKAAEFGVPMPKRLLADYRGLGMASKIKIPVGFDGALPCEIKWASFDGDVIAQVAQSLMMTTLTAMGSLSVLTSAGETSELPVICNVTGLTEDVGKIAFKAQENVDYTSIFVCHHVELYVAGAQIYLFDAYSNQYIVNGDDQLANYRSNIGG